jgi:hypothetical protein
MLHNLCRQVIVWMLAAAPAYAAPANADYTGSRMPYAAFDALEATTVNVPGGQLDVRFAPGEMDLGRAVILAWLERSAKAVATYYGRFPVGSVRLLIVPVDGRGVTGGQAFGYRGAAIRLMVGQRSTEGDLRADWKAVHEMVHLALPDLSETHLWLAEGLAVYVESIARVQAGDLTPVKVWSDMVRDMPQGLAKDGDRGLDRTPTWGRRYWGGAIFALQADVAIRKRTGNRKGLQDALRAVLSAGGNHEVDWPIARIFNVGDAATGETVLADLYAAQRATPVRVDLDALWRDLGIERDGDGVRFDDKAAAAGTRRAIEGSGG